MERKCIRSFADRRQPVWLANEHPAPPHTREIVIGREQRFGTRTIRTTPIPRSLRLRRPFIFPTTGLIHSKLACAIGFQPGDGRRRAGCGTDAPAIRPVLELMERRCQNQEHGGKTAEAWGAVLVDRGLRRPAWPDNVPTALSSSGRSCKSCRGEPVPAFQDRHMIW
jgi:hypothetical protein